MTIVEDGGEGIRTLDLMLAKHVLSQLSYTPRSREGADTKSAQGNSNPRPHAYQACALNQLSYGPIQT